MFPELSPVARLPKRNLRGNMSKVIGANTGAARKGENE